MAMQKNEVYLITELIKGNKQAFEELYYIYAAAIRINIAKLIKNTETVNDLLQEVFITLWEKRQTIDAEKGIAPWLYTVSYNKTLKFLRKKIREELIDVNAVDLSLFVDESEIQHTEEEGQLSIIYEAIERLPERKKRAFFEYKLNGKSLNQVADEMGITKEAVKGYLKDARKFILNYLETQQSTIPTTTILCIYWIIAR